MIENELTNIFPTEATGSPRAVRVQVSVSEVTLLVEPQTTLVFIHYLLPVLTVSFLSETLHLYISQFLDYAKKA